MVMYVAGMVTVTIRGLPKISMQTCVYLCMCHSQMCGNICVSVETFSQHDSATGM